MSRTKVWCWTKNNFNSLILHKKIGCQRKQVHVARKFVLCQTKKVYLPQKSVSCRQKQDHSAQKTYFVLKKGVNFFSEQRPMLSNVFAGSSKCFVLFSRGIEMKYWVEIV